VEVHTTGDVADRAASGGCCVSTCCAIFIFGRPVSDERAFTIDVGELDAQGSIIRLASTVRNSGSSGKRQELIEVFFESVKFSSDRVRKVFLEKVRHLPILESDGSMLNFGFIIPVQIELGDVVHAKGLAAYLNVNVHGGDSSKFLHNA
jgi:hypothetical protein